MRRIFSIQNDENLTLCLFEHRLIEYCKHYLISFSLENINCDLYEINKNRNILIMKKITINNLNDCQEAPYSKKRMREYLTNQREVTDGFLFYHKELQVPVGCLWVMYKGGNELQYRIRNIDAFGFDFCVFNKFRGNRFIEAMIYEVLLFIKEKGIDKLYASVRVNNTSALKAYKIIGVKIEAVKRFGRFINLRIPYNKI